ncbi:cadherin-like and PC-esterase domain-containing protein 1 [Protopterus annectens]|uniref:cadherin-like and PC-esterase domain-containing protein 1 n=1 Tax=Protopterus annectens TaxID=7888 RepID=UPI001CF988AD|nr:cadherin-like and PC-esterase domain-containing protein 1 [Protopterus annectens]
MMFYRWIMGGRRRCLRTPRPLLLLLLLAIYFFSETLWMIGWRRYSLKCTSEYDSWRDISELKEHLSRSNQRPLSLQTIQKIELLHLKHFGKQVKTVTFYGHHSIGVPEFQLYQRILTSYGYKVSIPEEDKLELIFNQEEDSFSTWDLLISFASGKDHISCNENYHLYHFQPYQKVNTLPEMKHILCRKEELCLMGKQFPELELSAVLSFCLDQKTSHNFPRSDTKMTKMNGLDDSIILAKIKNRTQVSSPELYQTFKQITPQDVLKEQEVSIMMKVYVLVTALRPLRAFIHSDGLVWNEQNKKYFATKLQSFFKNLLGVESSVQALNNIKETICKILLTTEMLTKASATERKTLQRCTLCFQFLTFDISFINTLHPVVLEIHGEYDFRDVKDIDSRDQSIEETILEDTFYILMSNLSVATTMYAVLQTMPSSVGIKALYPGLIECFSFHLDTLFLNGRWNMAKGVLNENICLLEGSDSFQRFFNVESNPLLRLTTTELMREGEETVSTLRNMNVLQLTRKLQNKMTKLKFTQWQRLHMEICLSFKVVLRGLRVLKMPTFSTTYPELLIKWQKLNLDTSHGYIKLLIEQYKNLEAVLAMEITSTRNELKDVLSVTEMDSFISNLTVSLTALDNKLLQEKKKKLERDVNDFHRGNVFSWPRETNAATNNTWRAFPPFTSREGQITEGTTMTTPETMAQVVQQTEELRGTQNSSAQGGIMYLPGREVVSHLGSMDIRRKVQQVQMETATTSTGNVAIPDENCQSMHLHCFSLEDFISVISFFKELNCTGKYEVVYPTSSQNYQTLLYHLYNNLDHHGELDSVMEMHLFLSELLEHFQLQNMQRESTGSPLWNITQEGHKGRASSLRNSERNTGLLNERHCSYDKSTFHLIREIRTSPKLNLHPEFKPEIREYYCEVPFDTVTVRIEAVPANCQCQVHLDHTQGPRIDNYPLGLGNNRISLLVTRESHSDPVLMGTYIINIYRENRPTLPLFNEYELCGFVQDCGLQIWPAESCGLQCLPTNYLSVISQLKFNSCKSGDAKGQWIVPCLSCSDNRTCDWREITWQPYSCQHPVLPRHQLQQCLDSRKVLFIGDSTNRGIMYYLIERVNDTLQEWDKEHGTKLYPNVNGRRTFVSYSYYPQFWLDFKEKPTFENSLEQLIQRSRPLKNNDQTVLVVGGVQWLNKDHLHILQRVLQRENLLNILVVIKSIGIGFHLPVEGIRSLSLYEVQNLWEENLKILYTAKQYGYEVVDTFSITVGRYKEFMQGKCACHFHEVVTSNISEEYSQKNMILRHAKSEKDFKSTIRKSELQEFLFNSKSHYHVKGPVNQVYSEIILSRICTHKNNSTAT